MIKSASLYLTILFFSLCWPATARELSIGTHGATITMDESWRRQELSPDVGPDQFLKEDGVYCVILENFSLLERRVDFEHELDVFLSNLKARFQKAEIDPIVLYQRRDGIGHGTQRVAGSFQSLNLAYQLDLVSRDGLGYLVMTWVAGSHAEKMYPIATELARSITFPDADSDWGKTAVPTPHNFRFGDWKIELSYRDSVFPKREDGDQVRSLTATEEMVAIHLFLDEYEDTDLEAALDDIISVVSEDEELEELERIDLELEAGPARQALLRQRTEQGAYDIAVVMVEVADSTYVDLRLVSMGTAGHRDRLWSSVLESLRVTPPLEITAFPVVEPAPETEASTLTRAAHELLSQARRIDLDGTSVHAAVPAADGSMIVLGPREILEVSADTETSVLFESENWFSHRQLLIAGDDILLVGDRQVSKVADQQLQPAGFDATYLAAAGNDLVLVREREITKMLGFDRFAITGPSQLIRRSASGQERIVADLDDLTVSGLAASPDGTSVLLAARDRHPLGDAGYVDDVELIEIDLSSAARRPLGGWSQIRALTATDAGWLVSGSPHDGLTGLYLFTGGGDPELLISGTVRGVELRDGELTFTVDVCLTDEGQDIGTCLYRTSIERVRQYGPACWPLSAETINRIAADVSGDAGVSTWSDVSSLVAAANRASERLTSLPLPSSPAAVDQLLGDLTNENSLTDEALSLLAMVMTDTLVREGGEWIGSSAPAVIRADGTGIAAENHFALALHPIPVLISTLYQDEGWWHPVQTLLDRADGRALLLGHDPRALDAEVARREPPAVAELIDQGKPAKLSRLLEEHRQNRHLRVRIYQHLAAVGHAEDLTRVARDFATVDDPAAEDLRAWLAGRLGQEPEAEELDRLIEDLKAAITTHPDLGALYLLLGAAYERTTGADRLELARACYKKTAEDTWGEIKQTAQRAIERIDRADP